MKKIFLVAGGTAGHINAAIAVGEYFEGQHFETKYFSGKRFLDYKLFEGKNATHLDTYPIRSKNPLIVLKNIIKNLKTLITLFLDFRKNKPNLIIGAGGYVCGPTLLAAKLNGVPVFIIEQNAVMGLTNRMLSIFANKIFVHFNNTAKLPERYHEKTIVSGNPVRSSITIEDNSDQTKTKNILVFGGSLGATQINQAIKELVATGTGERLHVIHQVGKNNLFKIIPASSIKYEQLEYIDDIGTLYAWADVIICRAGASTISELRIVRKPSILIPFPKATDNHQFFNALELQNENLFPMHIIDYRKNSSEIVKEVKKFLVDMKTINLDKFDNVDYKDPSEVIFKETEYVWN